MLAALAPSQGLASMSLLTCACHRRAAAACGARARARARAKSPPPLAGDGIRATHDAFVCFRGEHDVDRWHGCRDGPVDASSL